jgi:tRNA U34 5-methylaminomethyl-2-thiouridine-forming methyltransferase MnmC
LSSGSYQLVQLVNGSYSLRSLTFGETFHPVVGPVAEAEALYVKQLRLAERLRMETTRPFILWDVGLGAAANVLTVLDACRKIPSRTRILSFDFTLEPLEFASWHAAELGYFAGYEEPVAELLSSGRAIFQNGSNQADWSFHQGDFPALIHSQAAETFEKPDAILFDAFSPAKNPAMWTQPLFARIFQLLAPDRPCAIPTYSRSTMLRVSLLLAGFFVGAGHATGEKEETTIAANSLELIDEPLDRKWLARASVSTSAEPLWEPVYRQAPLSPESREKLAAHPQFC